MTHPTPAEIEAALKWADNSKDFKGLSACKDLESLQVLAAHIRAQSSELALLKAVVGGYCKCPVGHLPTCIPEAAL